MIPPPPPASTPAKLLPATFTDRWPELTHPTDDWLAWLTHSPRTLAELFKLAQDDTIDERYRLRAMLLASLPDQFLEPAEALYVRNVSGGRFPLANLSLSHLTDRCRQLLIEIVLISFNWLEQEDQRWTSGACERYEELQYCLIVRLTNDEVRPVLDAFRPYCLQLQLYYHTDRPCRYSIWYDLLKDPAVPTERQQAIDRRMREYVSGQRTPPDRLKSTPALALREYWVGLAQLANQHRPNGPVIEDEIDFFEEQVLFAIMLTTREASTVPSLFVIASIIKQIYSSQLTATLARALERWFQPDDRWPLPRNPLVVAELRRFAETNGVQWLRELLDRQVVADHDQTRRAYDEEIAKVQREVELYNQLRAKPD